MEAGYSVLVENIAETIDAVLGPVLGRNTIKKGKTFYIKLGDKEVEFSPDFRLFLHTKLSNPHYPPEIQAEATLINFTVTESGLEDQLLALVVKKERPDLEEQKAELIRQQNGFKIKLKELEDNLLYKLANAEGDILDDIVLIENLEKTKQIATEINEKVAIAKETEIMINEARENYRSNASRGSLLFFILNDLFKINTYYYYSLNSFVSVFERAISMAGKPIEEDDDRAGVEGADWNESVLSKSVNPFKKFRMSVKQMKMQLDAQIAFETREIDSVELAARLEELMDSVTFNIFNYVRRGLFEAHKLIVVTQLTMKVLLKMGLLVPAELDFLLTGPKSLTPPKLPTDLAWLPESSWAMLQCLQEFSVFQGICGQMETEWKRWKQWANEPQPENEPPPGQLEDLTDLQRMLLLRVLRPDRLTSALSKWVAASMGTKYVEQEPFRVLSTYKESSAASPLFFVLFPGADVVKELQPLCERYNFTQENGRFVNISMGQGQEKGAEDALDRFTESGGWVFLQNIHLMQSWLGTLERKLEIAAEKGHATFRCFLSAEPPPIPSMKVVPESIMQSSIKIANEPPQNMKANLRRAWANFGQATLERSDKPKEFRTVLFALCFFHSVMLGRRKFGSQGWSRNYSFNTGDLTICADVLFNYLRDNTSVPWDDLKYIFGEIMYGGHITDGWDRRTNSSYLQVIIKAELFARCELAPGFQAITGETYEDFRVYIEDKLPAESPVLFGLHPNAEIAFLTAQTDTLVRTIQDLQGAASGAGEGKGGQLKSMLDDFQDRLPPNFHMIDIAMRIGENKTPFLVVLLQECERMNGLLSEIRTSLSELKLGLEGALNISDAMEALSTALQMNRVPGTWEKVAYASLKPLGDWFSNLLERCAQLSSWALDLRTPKSLWLSGLFNPMAFVTAVMQVTARAKQFPLDQVTTITDVTKFLAVDEIEAPPEDGAYIHGFFLQGARWGSEEGKLLDQLLKELFPPMPVVHLRSIRVNEVAAEG
jgi:dynein heavy chain